MTKQRGRRQCIPRGLPKGVSRAECAVSAGFNEGTQDDPIDAGRWNATRGHEAERQASTRRQGCKKAFSCLYRHIKRGGITSRRNFFRGRSFSARASPTRSSQPPERRGGGRNAPDSPCRLSSTKESQMNRLMPPARTRRAALNEAVFSVFYSIDTSKRAA